MARSRGRHRLVQPSGGRFRDARADDPGIDDRRIADALVASTAVGRLIFPSDRGRQTASGDVRKQRVTFGMKGSMN